MNVLIMGCSFGVPDNGCPSESHTENQLKLRGHKVINCARSGSSNLESLALAEQLCGFLPYKIDWIVWFHTELIRDMSYLYQYSSYSFEATANLIYKNYSQFAKKHNAKLAVIGGAAPVHPTLFEYIQPDFCIPSWFNKILNLNLPQIQTLSRLDMIERLQGIGPDIKLKILGEHEEILNALEASDDFPDNYHPGIRPHVELANELHQAFLRS